MDTVRNLIAATRRRMRVQAMLDAGMLALGTAVMIGASALVLLHLGTIDGATAGVVGVIAALAVVIAMVAAALRRVPDHAVAYQIDLVCGLDDRLRTALELAPRLADAPPGLSGDLMRAAVRDGFAAAARVDPRRAAPYRLPRETRFAAGLMVFGAALAFPSPAPADLAVAYHRAETVVLLDDDWSAGHAPQAPHPESHDVRPAPPPVIADDTDLARGRAHRATIHAVAQQGTATAAYRKVYAAYRAEVEDVMHTERVPAAYRAYIKRYFAKIEPDPPL